MTILTAYPIVSTERMMWYPLKRMYVVEASDIGPFTCVYDDACDVGMTIVSHRFPHLSPIVLVVEHEERKDGDTLWWDLQPADMRVRKSNNFVVRVYND